MTRREANFWFGLMLAALVALFATAVNLGMEIERDNCAAGVRP